MGKATTAIRRRGGAKRGNNTSKTAVLVVGDWVVDEYWRLVRHHSDLSSHTGFEHYRSYWPRTDLFMDLCGAGQVTRILLSLQEAPHDGVGAALRSHDIVGVGIWHPGDQDLLGHLLHSRGACPVAKVRMRLTWESCNEQPPAKLVNLQPDPANPGKTTRVVRLYHMEESGTRQLGRIDWEEAREQPAFDIKVTESQLPNDDDVVAVVVQDFSKGVVHDELVKALFHRYKRARWFVRAKELTRPWIQTVRDRLELLVIGPEILGLAAPWESWLAHRRISFAAKQLLEARPDRCTVALVTEAYEVLVRTARQEGADAQCISARVLERMNVLDSVGWPSALFAALVAQLMQDPPSVIDAEKLRHVIQIAVRDGITRLDMRHASTPGEPAQATTVSHDGAASRGGAPTIRLGEASSWEIEVDHWNAALRDCGVIKDDRGRHVLEVGRAATALPGYVACIDEKRQIINTIGKLLRAFNRNVSDSRSVAILLQADPGTGKTYLAQRLAREFDFALVRRDITQMLHRDEIFDLFDSVATEQANQGKPVLVFVDEINAHIDAGLVYGSFLAPLEDGAYVRRGNAFNLKPCAWIFAGTDLEADKSPTGHKVQDFLSRMTLVAQIDHMSLLERRCRNKNHEERLRAEASLIAEMRLEQVYLGASMIHRTYPDVSQVAEGVLRVFYHLDPSNAPARAIRTMVRSLRNVQYGKITERNLPEATAEATSDLINLVFDPES